MGLTEPIETVPEPAAPKKTRRKTAPTGDGAVAAAVLKAAKAADWITPADAAATELALKLARDLDKLGADDAAQVASLARTFLAALASLGLTVAGRTATNTNPPQEEDPLAALRTRSAARLADPEAGDTATVRHLPRR